MWMGSDQPELSSSPNFTDGSLTEGRVHSSQQMML